MSRYKYLILLAAQILLSVVSPLFSSSVYARSAIDLGITVVFLTAISVISSSRKHFIIGMILMTPTLILIWGIKFYRVEALEFISLIGSVFFFCYIAWLILADIFRAKMVTLDIIAAGISVYLFFGNICGFIYAIIGRVDPNAFTIPAATASYLGDNLSDVSSAMYFSFVTLTTLGYGDITPINAFARSLAYLEAATGQIYLTVLIASLVGIHITTSGKGKTS
jgi:voltage-gated potassium channel